MERTFFDKGSYPFVGGQEQWNEATHFGVVPHRHNLTTGLLTCAVLTAPHQLLSAPLLKA